MASLRKLNNKFFARIRWTDKQGKRKEKLICLQTSSKRRANRLLKNIQRQEEAFRRGLKSIEDIKLEKSPTDFEKLWEKFIQYQKNIRDNSEKTLRSYNFTYKTLNIFYSEINIIAFDLNDFLKKLKKKYDNIYSINTHLRHLRAFLNWAKEGNYISEIPCKIKLLKKPKTRPRYFTDSEINQILEAVENQELYSRIILHWKTGIRLSEIHDSYLKNNFLKIFNPKKNGAERSIKIDKEIEKYYKIAKSGKYNDTTISKKFLDIIRKLNLYRTQEGDKRTFHCLRHTFAIRTYFETRDIYLVKKLLGHASVKTTEIYAEFNLEELENDFEIEKNNQNSKPQRDASESDFKNINYQNLNQIAVG
ncbi:MAG: tyrosine-type recombinase/integrase [Candidatus Marinimicrobia bacterium]|nr:tyrosine-type recombinase/integrase [Candidatus Neomarinimicrobiota bacterium]